MRSLAVLSMHKGIVKAHSSRSLSQLESLQVLDVSDTDFGNQELQQLQSLTCLRELNLTWTKITQPPLVSSLNRLELSNVEVQSLLFHRLTSSSLCLLRKFDDVTDSSGAQHLSHQS